MCRGAKETLRIRPCGGTVLLPISVACSRRSRSRSSACFPAPSLRLTYFLEIPLYESHGRRVTGGPSAHRGEQKLGLCSRTGNQRQKQNQQQHVWRAKLLSCHLCLLEMSRLSTEPGRCHGRGSPRRPGWGKAQRPLSPAHSPAGSEPTTGSPHRAKSNSLRDQPLLACARPRTSSKDEETHGANMGSGFRVWLLLLGGVGGGGWGSWRTGGGRPLEACGMVLVVQGQ